MPNNGVFLETASVAIALERPAHLSLADLAYGALVKAIVNQTFAPGQLLNVDSLAGQLQMSKTPVRESLMRLTGERLVIQTNNRGFLVTALLTLEDFHYLFQTRRLLEIQLLRAARITDTALASLQESVASMSVMQPGATYERYAEFNRTDHRFHETLAGMSPNRFTFKAWQDLHFHLHIARLYIGVGIFDYQETAKEHAEILHALEAGKPKRAAGFLEAHIERAENRLIALFEEN